MYKSKIKISQQIGLMEIPWLLTMKIIHYLMPLLIFFSVSSHSFPYPFQLSLPVHVFIYILYKCELILCEKQIKHAQILPNACFLKNFPLLNFFKYFYVL